MKNVFYFKDINSIGGCESYFYYLSCLYKNMIVYYKTANIQQIERLSKNIECHKYKGEKIKCDRFFCCYSPDIIDNVEAKEYIHLIHCDYKNVWFSPIINPKFTKYIGVSKLVCDSFKELTGIKAECIYNPISFEIPNVEKYNDDKLHLISTTRLTREKGLEKMKRLCDLLERANIDYEWIVYSNKRREYIGKHVIYKEPRFDIYKDMAKADYLVQLSDCEAYCYAVAEALMCKTKVLITDLPVFKEIGIDKRNAIYYDHNMNVMELLNKSKAEWTPPKSNWGKYLDNNSNYDPNELVEVKAKFTYTDNYLKAKFKKGEKIKMPRWRASVLEITPVRSGLIGLIDIVEG